MAADNYTSRSPEGEVGKRSEPGGGADQQRAKTPPSTSLRSATSPAEAGEESKVRRAKRTLFAQKLARNLRKQPTDAEKRLWYFLHKKQLDGLRFKRQEAIGKYVADFVCPALRLVIEVDGGQHGIEIEKDAARTAWLEAQGYSVIRFWNNEVMGNIEGVLRSIREEAAALAAAPLYTSPSSEGEVGERSEPGGGGVRRRRAPPVRAAILRNARPHPHRPRSARPLPPLKRGKDNDAPFPYLPLFRGEVGKQRSVMKHG